MCHCLIIWLVGYGKYHMLVIEWTQKNSGDKNWYLYINIYLQTPTLSIMSYTEQFLTYETAKVAVVISSVISRLVRRTTRERKGSRPPSGISSMISPSLMWKRYSLISFLTLGVLEVITKRLCQGFSQEKMSLTCLGVKIECKGFKMHNFEGEGKLCFC